MSKTNEHGTTTMISPFDLGLGPNGTDGVWVGAGKGIPVQIPTYNPVHFPDPISDDVAVGAFVLLAIISLGAGFLFLFEKIFG